MIFASFGRATKSGQAFRFNLFLFELRQAQFPNKKGFSINPSRGINLQF